MAVYVDPAQNVFMGKFQIHSQSMLVCLLCCYSKETKTTTQYTTEKEGHSAGATTRRKGKH